MQRGGETGFYRGPGQICGGQWVGREGRAAKRGSGGGGEGGDRGGTMRASF